MDVRDFPVEMNRGEDKDTCARDAFCKLDSARGNLEATKGL